MSLEHKNQELQRELETAMELIKRYEQRIQEIENQNSSNLRKNIHDLSNPLQVLSMTIESLQMKTPEDIQPSLERMRRSAEAMTMILVAMRKLRSTSTSSKQGTQFEKIV